MTSQPASPARAFRWYADPCVEAYWSLWGNGSAMVGCLLLGLVGGVPLAVLAADRGLGEALIWGLMWGALGYGLLLVGCLAAAALLFPVDVVRWLVNRVVRRRS